MFAEEGTKTVRTSVWIDLGTLEENYRAIRRLTGPDVSNLCIIKGDAYGHGAAEVGRRLESAGATYFGVADIDEGRELRMRGIRVPILVLGGVMPWEEFESFVEYDLTPAVTNFDMLERAAAFAATGARRPLKIHVKIDTGMGRLGFGCDELDTLVARLRTLRDVEIEGVMSHFSASETRDDHGLRQVARFNGVVARLRENGIEPRFAHMANSAGLLNYPEAHFTMVRPGLMLYGCYPDSSLHGRLMLRPVMRWTSRVSSLRAFTAGSALSYGGTYVTQRETRVAYVPVGYADGYPRALSNRGAVVIAGNRCPIVGRVCMDWLFVDVTGLPDVAPGDEVVLLGGTAGEAITAEEIAEKVGTIPYEVLCGVSKRITRRHVF
ncbi:MAG: alanine racemase [Syntrophorhabdales bacterium]|jgi:alanine racemase